MEVHHHGHVHHETVWKQYLSQFLMLFLAVFCGSLAEYYLEHNLERERETEYANSMIQDLDEDLINIEIDLKLTSERIQNADSLISEMNSDDYKSKTSMIYYRARKLSMLGYTYSMTDGTLMELKNSGNLRLIKSKTMVDSIQAYYNVYQQSEEAQEFSIIELDKYRDEMIQIFDAKVFGQMIKNFPELSKPEGNPRLFNENALLMNSFLMRVEMTKTNAIVNERYLTKLKNSAKILRESISKSYIED